MFLPAFPLASISMATVVFGLESQDFFYPLDELVGWVVEQGAEHYADQYVDDVVDQLRCAVFGYVDVDKEPKAPQYASQE